MRGGNATALINNYLYIDSVSSVPWIIPSVITYTLPSGDDYWYHWFSRESSELFL